MQYLLQFLCEHYWLALVLMVFLLLVIGAIGDALKNFHPVLIVRHISQDDLREIITEIKTVLNNEENKQ